MKNLNSIISKIAPITLEQYYAKLEYNKNEANTLVNMVTCQRKTVTLSGFRIFNNKKYKVFVKLHDWNACTQRVKLTIDFQTNEIPKNIAKDIINDYLNMNYEYDWSWN